MPGIGGRIKQDADDFIVEEIPRYTPSGEGEHLYLWVEKRNCSTPVLLRILGKAFKISERDIGYAGLKDRNAATRQWISLYLPGAARRADAEAAAERFSHDAEESSVRLLRWAWHGNKLKRGHLAGNRFTISIRDIDPVEAAARLDAIAAVLSRRGVPNYFGEQRFGSYADGPEAARFLMLGRYADAARILWKDIADNPDDLDADVHSGRRRRLFRQESWKALWSTMPEATLRVILNSYQSLLFNRFLAVNLDRIDVMEEGQLAMKHPGGALFVVEDVAETQTRCDCFDISPTGPLLGPDMPRARGCWGAREDLLFRSQDVPMCAIRDPLRGIRHEGARRSLRFNPGIIDSQVDASARVARLSFDLPPGSYATVLLREFTKVEYLGEGVEALRRLEE